MVEQQSTSCGTLPSVEHACRLDAPVDRYAGSAHAARLPAELLADIFMFVRLHHQLEVPSTTAELVSLTRVCNSWRSAALTHAALWNDVNWQTPIRAQEFVRRSRGAPLRMTVAFPTPASCAKDLAAGLGASSPIPMIASLLESRRRGMVAEVFGHLYRTKSLILLQTTSSGLAATELYWNTGAPMLESLIIEPPKSHKTTFALPSVLQTALTPNLRRLSLRMAALDLTGSLCFAAVLSSLSLQYTGSQSQLYPSVKLLLRLLRHAPLLQHLAFSCQGRVIANGKTSSFGDDEVVLPHLRTFSCHHQIEYVAELMSNLSVPSQVLHVKCYMRHGDLVPELVCAFDKYIDAFVTTLAKDGVLLRHARFLSELQTLALAEGPACKAPRLLLSYLWDLLPHPESSLASVLRPDRWTSAVAVSKRGLHTLQSIAPHLATLYLVQTRSFSSANGPILQQCCEEVLDDGDHVPMFPALEDLVICDDQIAPNFGWLAQYLGNRQSRQSPGRNLTITCCSMGEETSETLGPHMQQLCIYRSSTERESEAWLNCTDDAKMHAIASSCTSPLPQRISDYALHRPLNCDNEHSEWFSAF